MIFVFESIFRKHSHISQNEAVEHTDDTTSNKSFTVEGGLEDSTEVSSDSSIGEALGEAYVLKKQIIEINQ